MNSNNNFDYLNVGTFVELKYFDIRKIFYVKEINKEGAKGYLLDREVCVDSTAPYDFSEDVVSFRKNEMPRVWISFTLPRFSKIEFQNIKDIKKYREENANFFEDWVDDVPLIYRLAGDTEAFYGDGGESKLIYPVWIAPKLKGVEENRRIKLLYLLRELNEERKDFHADSPVRDIIDPDLFPRILDNYNANYILNKVAEIKFCEQNNKQKRKEEIEAMLQMLVPPENPNEGYDEDDYGYDISYIPSPIIEAVEKGDKNLILKLLRAENVKRPHKGLLIREKYQWIPAEFLITQDCKVKINTPINNIVDRIKYSEFYEEIEHIFEKMVPLFAKLHLISKGEETKLQVIVKAQEYDLAPGMTYAGRWHMEGQTEHIVAAGVYYLEVGELTGGNLKFRPKACPQMDYDIPTDYEIPINTGTGIAFSNTLPHRFRKMKNETKENQKRTFLNFFIVDPRRPIPYDNIYITANFLKLCLRRFAKENTGQHLPSYVMNTILSYIPTIWQNFDSAKEFRHKSRLAMLENKSGWGWIHWGNSGQTSFFESESTLSKDLRDRCYEELKNTESE